MSKEWLRAAAIRALKTMAETAVGVIGTSSMLGQVDWLLVGSSSLLSGVMSILLAIKGLPEVPKKLPEDK